MSGERNRGQFRTPGAPEVTTPIRPPLVYALCDPKSGAIRYIGSTTNPLEKRLSNHISSAGSFPKSAKDEWLGRLKEKGLQPTMIVLEQVPLGDLRDAEARWVVVFRNASAPLLNTYQPTRPIMQRAGND